MEPWRNRRKSRQKFLRKSMGNAAVLPSIFVWTTEVLWLCSMNTLSIIRMLRETGLNTTTHYRKSRQKILGKKQHRHSRTVKVYRSRRHQKGRFIQIKKHRRRKTNGRPKIQTACCKKRITQRRKSKRRRRRMLYFLHTKRQMVQNTRRKEAIWISAFLTRQKRTIWFRFNQTVIKSAGAIQGSTKAG